MGAGADELDQHRHDHGHDHSHGPGGHHHARPPAGFDSAFALGAALNAGFVAAEIVFGLAAHSVALLADAAHNLGDVLGLLLAWGAAWLGRRQPTRARTYGYGRSSILASLANAVVLLISVGAIAIEAIQRLASGMPPGASPARPSCWWPQSASSSTGSRRGCSRADAGAT